MAKKSTTSTESTDLATRNGVAETDLSPDRGRDVEYGDVALKIHEGVSLERWKEIGLSLQQMLKAVPWWLGDWWRFGERRWGELTGESVKQVTGKAYQTVRNYAWICGKFDPSLRRDNLDFTYYAELAGRMSKNPEATMQVLTDLIKVVDETDDPAMLDEILPKTREMSRRVREKQQEINDAKPDPVLPEDMPVLVEVGDATAMNLMDETVHLIVTSPPYGVDVEYRDSFDPAEAWPKLMADFLKEAYRVSRDAGRLAINVPLDTTQGGCRPTYAQIVRLAEEQGWTYRFTITWAEDNISKSTARGSIDSASAIHVISPVEMVAVFYKGAQWKRERPPEVESDLARDEWVDWTNGLWQFPGEAQAWEGHPAAFPTKLPQRLIKMLSFPGDTVLDPFCGSGSTLVAAYWLLREAIGFDVSEHYVKSTKRRLDKARTSPPWTV